MGERKTIGFKLKQLRENSGLRQGQIAEFLGVDQSYVSKVEADERALPIEQLEKLATLYGYDSSIFESDTIEVKPIKLALRARDLSVEDMHVLATISHIANNCRFMTNLLGEN